jgi:hypothetical protein
MNPKVFEGPMRTTLHLSMSQMPKLLRVVLPHGTLESPRTVRSQQMTNMFLNQIVPLSHLRALMLQLLWEPIAFLSCKHKDRQSMAAVASVE